ncbi:hypothetical protein [Emticicia sp. W12TSBA100-4]|uniref:hypothetical protein n=1 Tax=Emticicia sp. W12TSBA100-4 TaxID=3160965 RepID=UPI0033060E58
MQVVTFLSPEKFPNLRGTSKIAPAAITIKDDRIGINVNCFNQLNKLWPDFTNLHLLELETLDEEKKTVQKYFLVPCKDEKAWKVKLNSKNSSCSFVLRGLCELLSKKWSIQDPLILHKIPISDTPQIIKEYKGFQIEISKIEAINKSK